MSYLFYVRLTVNKADSLSDGTGLLLPIYIFIIVGTYSENNSLDSSRPCFISNPRSISRRQDRKWSDGVNMSPGPGPKAGGPIVKQFSNQQLSVYDRLNIVGTRITLWFLIIARFGNFCVKF